MKKIKFTLSVLFSFFLAGYVTAQDWPNLKRFQSDNAGLSTVTEGEERVVLMGNSITEGWSRHRPAFFAGKPYINRGISGQTTPQMLVRFRQDVVDLKPSVVAILAGINDIAGNTGPSTIEMITDNIFSMAEIAQANGIKVVLCAVLPAYDFPWRKGLEPATKVVALNTAIKKYAAQNGLVYVDYFTPMADEKYALKKDLGDDGVHPNAKGYQIMEPLLEAGIKKALTQN